MMRLATLLNPALLEPNLVPGKSKLDAVDQLLKLVLARDPAIDINAIRAKVVERETIENTSYARGFAFPHARTDAVSELYLAIGLCHGGLEECHDGAPLEVICLLLTPSHISKLYLQTLSALANFARTTGNLEKLRGATTREEMIDVFWNSGVMVGKEITVADLMRRDPICVREKQSLRAVANLMFRHRLSAIPVIDERGALVGQVTDRDLLIAALPDYKGLATDPQYKLPPQPFEELLGRADRIEVSQLYQADHETIQADELIVRAVARILVQNLRRLFVVDDTGLLIGVLHRKDIVNMILRG